ncbi:Arginyl-tRNA--protein transferase 1, partial [Tieghemiomyces parasiticus]
GSPPLPSSEVIPGEWYQYDKCSYSTPNRSYSQYIMHANSLTAHDYQTLVNRNWRRSGQSLYRRDTFNSCCNPYAIRLRVDQYRPSRSNRRTVNRVNRFLRTPPAKSSTFSVARRPPPPTGPLPLGSLPPRRERGVDPNNMYMRQYPTFDQCVLDGSDYTKSPDILQRLTVETVPARYEAESYDVYLRYQKHVHNDDPSRRGPDGYTRFLVASPLKLEPFDGSLPVDALYPAHLPAAEWPYVSADPADSDDELSPPSGTHHSFGSSPSSFTVTPDFGPTMVGSALSADLAGVTAYGTYHQQYRLDGVLIAVGVIDILPTSVSSVYLFYEPAYEHLNLGKYSSIREAMFTRRLRETYPVALRALRYYTMGYYIHACPKMQYKGDLLRPSQLLDPVTFAWVDYADAAPILDRCAHTSLVPVAIPHPSALDSAPAARSLTPWYLRTPQDPAYPNKRLVTANISRHLGLPALGSVPPAEMPAEVWDAVNVKCGDHIYPARFALCSFPLLRFKLVQYYQVVGHELAATLIVEVTDCVRRKYRAVLGSLAVTIPSPTNDEEDGDNGDDMGEDEEEEEFYRGYAEFSQLDDAELSKRGVSIVSR